MYWQELNCVSFPAHSDPQDDSQHQPSQTEWKVSRFLLSESLWCRSSAGVQDPANWECGNFPVYPTHISNYSLLLSSSGYAFFIYLFINDQNKQTNKRVDFICRQTMHTDRWECAFGHRRFWKLLLFRPESSKFKWSGKKQISADTPGSSSVEMPSGGTEPVILSATTKPQSLRCDAAETQRRQGAAGCKRLGCWLTGFQAVIGGFYSCKNLPYFHNYSEFFSSIYNS